jgi:hypothetical protein
MALLPKRKVLYKCSRNFLKRVGGSRVQNSDAVPVTL